MPYGDRTMRLGIAYAALICVLWLLAVVNRRLAYGTARKVDLDKEVIVITGGASGLGLLIAEVYGMRGASVAVLDVREMDDGERGIEYYRCDVGDREQIEKVARQIEKDVMCPCILREGQEELMGFCQLGTPTILINNAAVVNGKSLLELSPEQIEK